MAQPCRDNRYRALYAQLDAFVRFLADYADDDDATAFNQLVDELIALGYDAEGFKVAEEDLFYPVASTNSVTGQTTYRKNRMVKYPVLQRKANALLTHLRLVQDATVVEVDLPRIDRDR